MAERGLTSTPRRFGGAALALICAASMLVACICAPLAAAHQIGPNYDTVVRSLTPATPGLSATVDEGEGQLVLTNHSGKDVVVRGYEGEPFARLGADRRVYVNQNSPARYLNLDTYANVAVPRHASAKAEPSWKLVATDGVYSWHDHRIHWMSPKPPDKVAGAHGRVKIFDWRVPIVVAGGPGAISGSLFWVGEPEASGTASALIFAICALVVLICGAIWFRRSRAAGDDSSAEKREAW
ncbi:MAG: hypothetical protein QM648_03455 [Solirubrobacterales bacterium]